MDLLQFLHGHNRLNRYFSLIQKKASPICKLCALDAEESVIHLLFDCPTYSSLRRQHGMPTLGDFSVRSFPVFMINDFIFAILALSKSLLLPDS